MAPLETLAIFPWGDVIEEFLDPLGLTPQDYAARMQGGWLFGYAAALQRQGHRVVIIHASERVAAPVQLTHAETGAPIWLVPGRRAGGRLTRDHPSLRALSQWRRTPAAAFAKVLRAEGCRAMLIQDYEHARFDALAALGRLLGLRVLAAFQGGDVTLSPLERRVRPMSLAACHALIVPSQRERTRLAQSYGLAGDRLADIPNPVDGERWRGSPRAQARAQLGLPADGFLVVNHGRIDVHRKGLDVLLAAWRRVAAARPDARLVVIGSGQDHAAFAAMAAEVPSLRWLSSYVTDPAMIRTWLSAADAYVTLSRVEGMPVAPLEAMACGLPVIASDAHGLPDIFRRGGDSGGVVIPREDVDGAATALLSLAADAALRARLGAAARRTIEDRYSLAAIGATLDDLLVAPSPTPYSHSIINRCAKALYLGVFSAHL